MFYLMSNVVACMAVPDLNRQDEKGDNDKDDELPSQCPATNHELQSLQRRMPNNWDKSDNTNQKKDSGHFDSNEYKK